MTSSAILSIGAKRNDATAYPWSQGSDHSLKIKVGSKDHSNEDFPGDFLSKQQDA